MLQQNLRIAIVNDMLLAVEALRRVLITVPEFEIAWIARNGAEAVKKCAADTPDLILMDLLMPVMDGVEATRTIMNNTPCAILIVTATVTGNNSKVFQAMGYGALDAVNTPTLEATGNPEGGAHLLAKIRTISKLIGKSVTKQFTNNLHRKNPVVSTTTPHLIAIGSSTGGPQALATLLSSFTLDLPAAIVIVQHVNAQFSAGLAEWLSNQIKLPVSIASPGVPVQKGKIFMAGTNDHLILQPNLTLKYTPEPRDNPYRPSVDTFFKSLAENWPTKGIAVLLTGMGKDGSQGLMCLRSAGWHTIAQDRSTSVVYGMPKAAADLGAAVEILPIDAIANSIQKRLVYSQ